MSSVVLVTGAGRGIGLELVRSYAAAGWTVLATVREAQRAAALRALPGRIEVLPGLDVTDPDSVAALAAGLNGRPLDLLINNAGVYGPDSPELGRFDYRAWEQVLAVNTLGPVRVTEALLPNLRAGTGRTIASLTSLMGSIGDNSGGGALFYRSSKAGLNAAMKTVAIALRPERFTVVVLHPGWVRTDMGGPSAPLDVQASAAGLIRVIGRLGPGDSGRFFNYDGRELPW
ncbi:MAG: SDR family oxidoreductase [Rhodospirillaceae bacterium]